MLLVNPTERTAMNVQTENARGEWVPAIPGPYLFAGHTRCSCGKRFLGRSRGRALRRYEEHYALHHILKPPRARQPKGER